jgi:ParB-like chromosome segregation protein Spo0J
MTDLQVVRWPVERLLPYARNARTHSDEQLAQIAASIAEFGWTNPILAGGDGVVIAGHARLLAARKAGITEVPVIVLDHLSESQRRALVIADNRLALNAGWDEEMLRVELDALREDAYALMTLDAMRAEALAPRRVITLLVGIFAVLAAGARGHRDLRRDGFLGGQADA